MAKNYKFSFTAQTAEFQDNGIVGIMYGGPETRLAREEREMTWAEAQLYLKDFAKAQPGPCACTVNCLSSPVPPGYRTANRTIFKKA